MQNAKQDSGKRHSRTWWEGRVSVLKSCRDTLETMSAQFMTGQATLKYVRYFDLLCREVLKKFGEPSLWYKRTYVQSSIGAHTEVQSDDNIPIHAQLTNGIQDLGATPFNVLPANASPGNTLPDHETATANSQGSLDAQSISSPFAWLNDPNAALDFAEFTCQSTQSHLQPCYCDMTSGAPASLVSGSAIQADESFTNFLNLDFNQPWMNVPTAAEDLLLSDWGDIFVGADKFSDI